MSWITESSDIINAVTDIWGLLALVVLVLGALAVKMTTGAQPNVRVGTLLILAIIFGIFIYMAMNESPTTPHDTLELEDRASDLSSSSEQIDLPLKSIVIHSNGQQYSYRVWLARSYEERARGFMHLPRLHVGEGMLFEFDDNAIRSFWMKNTDFPLDFVFIRQNGSVDSIADDAVPHSVDTLRSDGPVKSVLALGAEESERIGIVVGDFVSTPL